MNLIKRITDKLRKKPLLIKPVVMPLFSQDNEKGKTIKSLFLTYFDGCYGVDAHTNASNTFVMGVCKLEYKEKENELIVHLRRPGLLIGKGGSIIDAVAKYLDCKIGVVEVNLYK